MWNYQSSSRSSIPRDRWRVSACPPPEGEGVHWWSLSEVVLPGHRRPTPEASRNGWPGPQLRPEPDQHTLCLQSLLHWKKEHRINLWKQLSIKSNSIFRQCLPVSQAGQTSRWFNHRVHFRFSCNSERFARVSYPVPRHDPVCSVESPGVAQLPERQSCTWEARKSFDPWKQSGLVNFKVSRSIWCLLLICLNPWQSWN